MIIKCWGARGSIPVCGIEFLKYGGDTTCIEIKTKKNELIIIDAGSGIRNLGNSFIAKNNKDFNILFTHSHLDHLIGFPFFKPIYKKDIKIHISGCSSGQSSIKDMISETMAPPYFPVKLQDIKADIDYKALSEEPFTIDSVTIDSIPISHPNMGLGYKLTEGNKRFVFLTDNELNYKHPGGRDFQDYLNFSKNADLFIHDAEFTETEFKFTRTWGHSVYLDALELALEAKVKRFGLFHHNQERTDKELDQMVNNCRDIIKKKGSNLECFAVHTGMEIDLN
jgi:phosphoribosyl 1,2-cyclic phosphodiesterase